MKKKWVVSYKIPMLLPSNWALLRLHPMGKNNQGICKGLFLAAQLTTVKNLQTNQIAINQELAQVLTNYSPQAKSSDLIFVQPSSEEWSYNCEWGEGGEGGGGGGMQKRDKYVSILSLQKRFAEPLAGSVNMVHPHREEPHQHKDKWEIKTTTINWNTWNYFCV